MNRSIEAIPSAWFRRNVIQPCDGGRLRRATLWGAPRIHGELTFGLVRRQSIWDRRRIRRRTSGALVPEILQQHPNAPITGQGLTADEIRPSGTQHSSAAGPRRIAPSLRPHLISDRHSPYFRGFASGHPRESAVFCSECDQSLCDWRPDAWSQTWVRRLDWHRDVAYQTDLVCKCELAACCCWGQRVWRASSASCA